MVFHILPDFDVAKTPDATLFAKFVGRRVVEDYQINPYWKSARWFISNKSSLKIS